MNQEIEKIKKNIKHIDSLNEELAKYAQSLKELHELKDDYYVYKFKGEAHRKFLSTFVNDDNVVHNGLGQIKREWEDLLTKEDKLKREYIQQIRLDRTIKLNSLFLRVVTTFGVIVVSILVLNIAPKFGLNIPWIFSRNMTSITAPIEKDFTISNQVEKKISDKLD